MSSISQFSAVAVSQPFGQLPSHGYAVTGPYDRSDATAEEHIQRIANGDRGFARPTLISQQTWLDRFADGVSRPYWTEQLKYGRSFT